MNPFLASTAFSAIASALGRRSEQSAADRRTAEANARSIAAEKRANRFNERMVDKAHRRDKASYGQAVKDNRANARTDFNRNLAASRQNSATDYKRSMAAMDKANRYTREQALEAREYDRAQRAEERELALDDQSQQFVRMREAAEKAGINPLSALGVASMTPQVSALQSSSFGASVGAPGTMTSLSPSATMGANPAAASTAMSYGAPVFVAPVASNDAVLGAVGELGAELTGRAAVERANAQFSQEVARIEGERQAAGGFSQAVMPSAPGVLAPSVVTVDPVSGTDPMNPYDMPREVLPVGRTALTYEGVLPNGEDYTMLGQPGDGIDELLGYGTQIAVQDGWRTRSSLPGFAMNVLNPVRGGVRAAANLIGNLPSIFPPDEGGYVPGAGPVRRYYPPVGQQSYTMESF